MYTLSTAFHIKLETNDPLKRRGATAAKVSDACIA